MSSLASRPPAPTRFLLPMAVVFLLVGCLAAPVSAQTVPGAPTRVTATPANGSIILNWSAPASDGGSAISSYPSTCAEQQNPRGGHGARPGNVRYSWTITGLTNGTPYNCWVSAYNAIGQGAVSTVVSATPVPVTNWVQLASGWLFTSATVGSADRYGGIVSGKHYAWNGTDWGSDGMALAQVAYGNDGARWGVDANYAIYRWGTSWTPVPGGLKQISVGSASHVWGVNSAGDTYRWTGTGFMPMNEMFASVSVAADGTGWALKPDDSIWRWNGLNWTPSAGSLRWISAGSASNVWGVNSSGLVYKLNAATGGWEMPTVPSGTFKGVATASDGTTLLLRSDGALWMK